MSAFEAAMSQPSYPKGLPAGQSGTIRLTEHGNVLFNQRDPTHAEAFYRTTNGEYAGVWHDGTAATEAATQQRDIPPISHILGARPTVHKPVRPLVHTAECVLANQIEQERLDSLGDKVISSDKIPKKFPVKAEHISYPHNEKHGASNPLFWTTAQLHGKEQPMEHQLPDRYFPSTNQFTKKFLDTKPRYTGLNTAPTFSKIHSELDQKY
eukprot:gnl/TRDRNA2_/TRDRNA2_181320_c0_seq1.p1 gnl/TRDRNA2_/TRDRNA2_181320_c0~~gnl/TRDRNA2_/TRDRNA2_181320_c0_seq1.p1  ORF type:complete len:210 (-),score=38.40 gnl/TRDRNA2_/TRDRNA2_181320_c0_seq1:97-726(-)